MENKFTKRLLLKCRILIERPAVFYLSYCPFHISAHPLHNSISYSVRMSQLATLILSYFEEEMRHHYIVSGSHGPCALDNELIRTKQQAKYQISEFDIFFVRNEEVARRIIWKKMKKKFFMFFIARSAWARRQQHQQRTCGAGYNPSVCCILHTHNIYIIALSSPQVSWRLSSLFFL